MPSKNKVITNYSNVTAYTKSKIDNDIEKVTKAILRPEDYIFHFQDTLEDKKRRVSRTKRTIESSYRFKTIQLN